MRRAVIALAAAGAVVVVGVAAHAEQAEAERLLERAVEAYDDLRIEASLDLLVQAERAGGLEGESLARAHLYRGLCRASIGQSEEAAADFRQALELDEGAELPGAISPVVRRQFAEIREELYGTGDEPPPPPDDGNGGEGDDPDGGQGPVDPPPPPPQLPPPPHRLLLTWVGLGLTGALFVAGATSTVVAEATRAAISSEERAQRHADDLLDAYRLEARLGVALLSTAVAMGLTTLIIWLGERVVDSSAELPTVSAGPSGIALSGPLRF